MLPVCFLEVGISFLTFRSNWTPLGHFVLLLSMVLTTGFTSKMTTTDPPIVKIVKKFSKDNILQYLQ